MDLSKIHFILGGEILCDRTHLDAYLRHEMNTLQPILNALAFHFPSLCPFTILSQFSIKRLEWLLVQMHSSRLSEAYHFQ